MPQIIGTQDQIARQNSIDLFRKLTNNIINVSSCEAAEVTKLVDNTYRDVTFAFGNEVARVCDIGREGSRSNQCRKIWL